MDEWWTISDVAEKLDIPNNTIRRYITIFKDYLTLKLYGRTRKLSSDSLQVITTVSQLYKEGKNTAEIKEIIEQQHSRIIEIDSNKPDLVLPNKTFEDFINTITAAIATPLQKEISSLKEEICQLKEQIILNNNNEKPQKKENRITSFFKQIL